MMFTLVCGDPQELEECFNECGLDTTFFSDQSSGEAPKKQLPFVGQLEMRMKDCDEVSRCTATIVSKNYILTVYSCMFYPVDSIILSCPNYNWQADKEDPDGEFEGLRMFRTSQIKFVVQTNLTEILPENEYEVENITKINIKFRHRPDYLALLKLKTPIKFSVDKRAACLMFDYQPKFGDKLRFVGFGAIPEGQDNENSTNYTQEVSLAVQSNETCLKYDVGGPDLLCVISNDVALSEGGSAYFDYNGRLFSVGVASKTGRDTTDVSDGIIQDYERFDTLIRLTPFLCRLLSHRSNGEVKCDSTFLPISEKCKNMIEASEKASNLNF